MPAAIVAAQEPPRTLEDLIPDSAVENPEEWAEQGVEDAPQQPEPEPIEEAVDEVEADVEAALDQAARADSGTIALPDDVPLPEPLEPDPEVTALAEIDAPDLMELPDLAEVEISSELVLAFPTDPTLFPEREEFVRRFSALSTIEALDADEDTLPQLAARARADEELLTETLRTYGYYNGEVIRQLSGGRREQSRVGSDPESDPRVRFDVIPGPRYAFGAIDLGALGALPDPDGESLRATFAIRSGDPLYADRIVAQRSALDTELGESGYPFATLSEPELLIDHARIEGDLTMPVDPNGKYVFGEVVSNRPEFLSGRHLGRIARFDPGDTYQRSLETDLRRAILATGLVSSVAIEPREVAPPEAGRPGEVALDVTMEQAPLRTIAGAIGYGTEEGARIEASWEHRNLFPPEGALRLRGILGTREQLASIAYRRNNFRARDQVLTVDAYASDLDTEAIEARTVALRGTFERISNLLYQKPLSWAVGAEVLWSDERNATFVADAAPRQEYLIGGLFGRATLDSSDDLLDPTRGFRLTGSLAPDVSRSQGVTSFYVRGGADARYYQSVGSTVLAGRAHVSSIVGADTFDIAPSRRLYAGGGGSVRGYGFQAIGPRDDDAEPIGGRSLVELSLEARIETGFFDGALEVVPFVDAGSVSTSSTPDFGVIRVGAGVGIRYKTSFGPIRVDVGVPLNPDEFDSPVAVYVSLGQAF
ncbi:autotransporter assembly complex family protein [Erythrobacter sp. JK5]|uniref:autotransporter assembly complex protein TamA n=1 Tax=Erythrobacter sp. JK5 TaxID=2829500 RepID=UPI001BA9E674|nr:BamA/TamA family outer membrane protein [Erythrobacter sp. JK5]QUL36575.1 BamA/TamA family outer membrane protein [Erythrobacter sp. JK5]